MNVKLIIFLFFVGYSTATTIEEDELLYNDSFWSVLKGIAGALFGDEARDAEAVAADRDDFIGMFKDFQHPRRDVKRAKFLAMLDQKLREDNDEEADEPARGFDAPINNAEKVKLFEELIKLKQQQGKGKRSQSTKRGDDDY